MKVVRYLALGLVIAGGVQAHTGAMGVTLERMQGMSAMADALKAMAPMVRGQAAYNANIVRQSAQVLQTHAGTTMVDLFEPGTGAAPSEAAPAVWDAPDRFAQLAQDLREQAAVLDSAADDPAATAALFADIGRTCSACHQDYRIKRN